MPNRLARTDDGQPHRLFVSEENQAVRRRKGLDPTYPRTGSPCSLAQPPLATPQDAADVLALDFDSLAPPMEASGPLSCPLPTAATGFFDDALGSAAFQATQPAKPYLFLNATFNTYEEIGKAVVAQYEVVFAPTGDAVAPRLNHSRSSSGLHDPPSAVNPSATRNLCPPNLFWTRIADARLPSYSPPLKRPRETSLSPEARSLMQALRSPASAGNACSIGSAPYSPTSRTVSSCPRSAPPAPCLRRQ
jgi:hypothetical protein